MKKFKNLAKIIISAIAIGLCFIIICSILINRKSMIAKADMSQEQVNKRVYDNEDTVTKEIFSYKEIFKYYYNIIEEKFPNSEYISLQLFMDMYYAQSMQIQEFTNNLTEENFIEYTNLESSLSITQKKNMEMKSFLLWENR